MPSLNKSPLKILHILDHSLPLHSGYSFRSQNIFRTQLSRGWQPVVLTSPKHEKSWTGQWNREEIIGGIRYYRTGSLSDNVVSVKTECRLMASLARRMGEIVAIEKPDLLHAHSPVLTVLPALWIRHRIRVPLVYEIRAFWEDAAVDHGTYGQDSWKYKLVKSVETWACQRADQVVVLCHGLKDELMKRGIPSEKLAMVFNGINVDDFKAGEPDPDYLRSWKLGGKKVVGFIGSFYRYEGLDLLVDAVAHLGTTRPDIVLLLVGGGEMESELRSQIKRLKLEEKVVMPGRISHDRIPGVYALVDVLAYPRHSIRLTELVTPLKPLEAMAMGKGLVASDIGGHRELIQHGRTGLLFPAGNTQALAEALERLVNNQALRHDLGKQGKIWACQQRSWDKTTAVYSDIYHRALEKFKVKATRSEV